MRVADRCTYCIENGWEKGDKRVVKVIECGWRNRETDGGVGDGDGDGNGGRKGNGYLR